nr:MFS transporter [Arthrobacter sp. NicSoilB8]
MGVLGGTALAGRTGRPRVKALAAAIFAVGSDFLGAARLLTGVGAALTTSMTLVRNHAPEGRVSLVITIAMAGVPMEGIMAALAGIFLMPVWGWRSMFWLGTAMIAVILAIILLCRITEPAEMRAMQLARVQKFTGPFAGRGYIFVGPVGLAAITNLTTWLGLNVWPAESMKTLGFSLTETLICGFTLNGAAVIGSWFTANAADKYGSATVGIVCTALALTGLVKILLEPVFLVFFLACVTLMGIDGHSAQNLINATATSAVAPHSRGTILG